MKRIGLSDLVGIQTERAARFVLLGIALVFGGTSLAATDLRRDVESYVSDHQGEILSELVEALSIPGVASDAANIRRKADHLTKSLARRGFETRLLETAGNPLVYGELKARNASRTLLIYCHYDGQPVDPLQWRQESPWKPIMRSASLDSGGAEVPDFLNSKRFEPDWRLYARSASDDTSPIVGLLAAIDALESSGHTRTANLRVVLDGEEEAGSPNLAAAITDYRELLEADLMLILDGPLHPSNRPTLVFGARGILTLRLTVFGPRFPLHSGHYGNWAPNPAMQLAQLLATMKDAQGRTLVRGFYDGIHFPEDEVKQMASVPDDQQALMELFGIADVDRVGNNLQEARNFPSLNIRGLRSAWVEDQVRTIIPDQAIAELDVRLVKETPAEDLKTKILAHIEEQGFHVVTAPPDDEVRRRFGKIVLVDARNGTPAYRTPLDDPLARRVALSLENSWGHPPVLIRTSGGTVPISHFIDALQFPALSLPIVNFDNNQHSPNENLRLGHLWDGIVSIAAVLTTDW